MAPAAAIGDHVEPRRGGDARALRVAAARRQPGRRVDGQLEAAMAECRADDLLRRGEPGDELVVGGTDMGAALPVLPLRLHARRGALARRARVEELVDGALDLLRRGRHVVAEPGRHRRRPERGHGGRRRRGVDEGGGEADLPHGPPGRGRREPEQPQDAAARLQVAVGGGALRERPDERVEVADQPARAHLSRRLAQEVLLAGGAHDVVVVVAEAHVVERVLAAQPLVAGLHVDLRVVLADRQAEVRVVVAAVDVDVDAVHDVDRLAEAREVDRDRVIDAEAALRRAEQILDRARGQVQPACSRRRR